MNSLSSSHNDSPCACIMTLELRRCRYKFLVVAVAALFFIMPRAGSLAVASPVHGMSCNVSDASLCAVENFFLNQSGCCQQCTTCPEGMDIESPCNSTHDTQCIQKCVDPNHQFRENHGGCVVDCTLCTYMCSPEENRCICDPAISYLDDFCQIERPSEAAPSSPPVVPGSGSPSTLPSWGVGLIAVGAVLGIIVFSAGFLFMGVCTSKRRREVDSEGSETSNSVLVSSGRVSGGTHSTVLPGYHNQSLIDLLRQANSPAHSSLNSAKSSPKSMRSSPLSVRIEAENYHLNTKSPVFFALSNHNSPVPVRTIPVKTGDPPKSSVV